MSGKSGQGKTVSIRTRFGIPLSIYSLGFSLRNIDTSLNFCLKGLQIIL